MVRPDRSHPESRKIPRLQTEAFGIVGLFQTLQCLQVRDSKTDRSETCSLSQFGQSPDTITNTNHEDVRELPAYGIAEAAHYLLLPRATLRAWLAGMSRGPERQRFKSVIEPAAISPVVLSFINLVEAHMLSAIRRKHRVNMPAVRRAISFLKREFGSAHPLADHKFETNGVDLFVERSGELLSVSEGGQLAVRELLEASLRRIERDDRGFPLRQIVPHHLAH